MPQYTLPNGQEVSLDELEKYNNEMFHSTPFDDKQYIADVKRTIQAYQEEDLTVSVEYAALLLTATHMGDRDRLLAATKTRGEVVAYHQHFYGDVDCCNCREVNCACNV